MGSIAGPHTPWGVDHGPRHRCTVWRPMGEHATLLLVVLLLLLHVGLLLLRWGH